MNKKRILGYSFLAVSLLVCVLILVIEFLKTPDPLEREKDKEFASGSQISVGQLSDAAQDSLYKLCKVWGYVKYHHPSVVDGTLNWDAELFRVMPGVLRAQTEEELNDTLLLWLNGFPFDAAGPGEEAEQWMELQKQTGYLEPDDAWIRDRAFLGEDLSVYLEKLSDVYISDRKNAYAAFAEDSMYVSFGNEAAAVFEPEDDGMKLLALFRFWNMYEYYSPNINITQKDWDAVLKEAIPEIIAAGDYRDYVLAIAHVASETGDAHITVSDKQQTINHYYGSYTLPCRILNVNGKVVVSAAPVNGSELKLGDIIEEIDGVSIDDRITVLSRYTVLPEPDKFVMKLSASLLKTDKELANVRVTREGESIVLQVKALETPWTFRNPYKNGLMEEGQIGYVDPSALKNGSLEKLMNEFENTDGIIVDLRYYPSVFIPYLLGEYIVPEPKQFAKMSFPNRAMPGYFFYSDAFYTGAGMMKEMGGKESYPHYDGKVVILMDENSMSQSEFTVMALRQAPNAVVLGSPSIGADGNVVSLFLPGGISMNISGLGVYTPDGGQTQRTGLKPDIECRPTVEGLRENRDELIEKATAIILESSAD